MSQLLLLASKSSRLEEIRDRLDAAGFEVLVDSPQENLASLADAKVPVQDECYIFVLVDRVAPSGLRRIVSAKENVGAVRAIASRKLLTFSAQNEGIQAATVLHASSRWAAAVIRILDSREDPNTVAAWGSCINTSSGALRNWCRTAGIGARRSLVFGRMLRAVVLGINGGASAENLLNVTDKRTLKKLFETSGLGVPRLPSAIDDFLDRQILVRDPGALSEIRRLLAIKGLRTAR